MKKRMIFTVWAFFSSCNVQAVDLYVSPDGHDANPGTKTAPLQTIERARDAVREVKRQTPEKPIRVYLKGGRYFLENSVLFTHEDSGAENAPVTYQAVKGEYPVFTAGRELKNWQPVADRERIFVTDLKTAGITDLGDPTDIGRRPELFCNGEVQTLARWPDDGYVKAGVAKGPTELAPTYIKRHGTVEGVFEYIGQRQNLWGRESDARLHGYWHWDWCDASQRIDKIDTLTRTMYVKQPYHEYGYRDSLRYFGLNLFCELDQPGEWYLDRNQSLLYWYPPNHVNPEKASVTLSATNAPFMFEMRDCSYLTLHGLAFQEGRGSAVLIRDGKNCLISDCRIERFGHDGIHVQGGSGHGISGCLLRTFGCGGIKISGGDRKQLIPAGHFVENTIVENFSLFKRTYEPAVHIAGCGIRINNNRFRYSSSSAMRLEGNDFLIEYNEISHVVSESDDQGGLDVWYNPSYRGLVVRFNHWSDISGGTMHGAAGVRLDDMISGVAIYGNIFSRCGTRDFGGVQIHGGKDNMVENNLFYHCFAAVSFSTWGNERWLQQLDSPVIQKKIFEEVDIRSAAYQGRYPELKDIRENPDVNTIKNNLLVDCTHRFLRNNDKQLFNNNASVSANGESLPYFCSAKILKQFGMQPIPLRKIGPKKNKWIE